MAALSPQLFKDPECWFGRGLNQRSLAQQTGAYPLTGRRFRTRRFVSLSTCKLSFSSVADSDL